ncbi:YifB family Mg chelatase-like AAA ATPase [Geobacillus sp. E263]|uniref:YifB family Mg chelatase-like AAA ATPase n=1 Tax=Geobacillus sp. E263 TaxID=391290 RepID=UPI00117B00A7|nr:YifB family Mg chelatase-like AAA ATPase [Geobacillus sp. E263]
MTVKILSIGLRGLEGYRVQVEVQEVPGIATMVIVGLPDASVKEAKERVLASLYAFGCDFFDKRLVVHLSPPERKKHSPMFDLAMAIGILKAMGKLTAPVSPDAAFLGSLSLDGAIQPVDGMLPAILAAKKLGFQKVYLPYDSTLPLHHLKDLDCIFVQTLEETVQYLQGQRVLSLSPAFRTPEIIDPPRKHHRDFQSIIGHHQAKRALEIAAAGGHNVLMVGPPGCGKSLLAETFPTILPSLSHDAQLEVISLYQLAGEKIESGHPPFRHPHHSASSVSLIGGGTHPKPGEVSLAHRGVLFLDEMAEFAKKTLDMLRQPLETGKVTISRISSTVTYPADFILLGAMNPCPCGYLGSRTRYCTCSPKQIQAYRNRVSGPIYDRMDVLLSLEVIDFTKETRVSESSETIRKRVEEARRKQYERYGKEITNGRVPFELLMEKSPLAKRQQLLLQQWASQHQWSNRVQTKIIRLARTISDLKGTEEIADESLWEAMTLRWLKTYTKQQATAR